jgi:DNA gyrase subunit B
VWELIDNAVDEAAAGHANRIEVTFHRDGSIEVADNGRGIPIDPRTSGRTALEVVFTELHAGGKFGSGAYGSSGGLHGVGASVVNALATKLVAEVDRDGHTWRLGSTSGCPDTSNQRRSPPPPARDRSRRSPDHHRHPGAVLARHRDLRPRGHHRVRDRARAHRPHVLPRPGLKIT